MGASARAGVGTNEQNPTDLSSGTAGKSRAGVFTCQICGREIKSANGLIAHHGYRRLSGYQTNSCIGARNLPYEKSCDLIPSAIAEITRWMNGTIETIAKWKVDPPAELTKLRRGVVTKIQKPDDFSQEPNGRRYIPDSYENEFFDRMWRMGVEIREAKAELEFLNERLKAWKPQ